MTPRPEPRRPSPSTARLARRTATWLVLVPATAIADRLAGALLDRLLGG
ncbi:hypothetical protein [Saccharothrix obliqua]|nr:hypothetical protein [Saccharothrix obliqua]MBW4718063.1 hypothetical protein [Saccharothrix obliqua]